MLGETGGGRKGQKGRRGLCAVLAAGSEFPACSISLSVLALRNLGGSMLLVGSSGRPQENALALVYFWKTMPHASVYMYIGCVLETAEFLSYPPRYLSIIF
jgi:hypothetical protein